MAKEKITVMGDIKKLTSSMMEVSNYVSDLEANLKNCFKAMDNMSDPTIEFDKALSDLISSGMGAYNSLSNIVSSISGIKNVLKGLNSKFLDSDIMLDFEIAVESGVLKSSKYLKDFKGELNDSKISFSDFVGDGKEKILGVSEHIKTFGENAGRSFSKFKESISNVSFKSIKDGIKDIPNLVSDKMNAAGNALTANASKIGSMAGSLLSGGIVAAIALIVATVVSLIAIFKELMKSNEEFRDKITTAWNGVKDAFEPAVLAFKEFKEAIFGGEGDEMTPFVEGICSGIEGLIESITEAVGLISEIIVGLFDVLIELWEEYGPMITEYVTGFFDFISELISGAVEIVKGVLDIIVGLFTGNGELIKEGLGLLWEGICGIFSAGLEFVGSIFSMAWEVICGIFSVVAEFFGNVFSAGWEAIKNAFSFVGEFFSNVWDGIKNVFAKVGSWFGSIFKSAWNGVKNAFSGCVKFFSNIWSSIKSMFSKIGTAIGNGISGAFKSVVNAVISFASGIINGFIGAINGAIRLINKIPGVEIPVIARVSLPRLAKGGIVDAGQMFIAREAGPELVGPFNGKTAVMNNDQIVASVSKGVYSAVSAALGSNMVGGDWTIQIVDNNGRVKSQDIITAIERRNRRDGKTIIALGV